MRRPTHEGALVAIWCGRRLLLVRQSYQGRLAFPGGGVRGGEDPADAAIRELGEELGLVVARGELTFACRARGRFDGRRDTVTFFELRLGSEPSFRLDHREIVATCFVAEAELSGTRASRTVAHYLEWRRRRG